MTARSLDGRGVRVTVVGDKAKGASGLFDTEDIKREWWGKGFMPNLVKAGFVYS